MHSNLRVFGIFFILVILSYLPFLFRSAISFVLFAILFFAVFPFLLKLSGLQGLKSIGLHLHTKWRAFLLLGVGIGVLFNTLVYMVIRSIHEVEMTLPTIQDMILIILFAMATAGFSAFSEEMIFRGYLIKHLSSRIPIYLVTGVVITMFTLYHLPQWGLPTPYWIRYAVMALVFTIPLVITKSLWLSVGLHWGGNMAFYLLLSEHGFLSVEKSMQMVESIGWVSACAGFILLIVMYPVSKWMGGRRDV
ncbi:CPBP family intramembrane glutamic endopeptidase [Caldalkalibacillus mannanilyticus]|uniref:CPBP family intramembrane glutamic endopeptidase n=1 Tax=Caldalkalibacillus mannanilyticus TaxID=1418 RepID=UPI00046AF0D9|nr:CPBP family intramembrane glutamic endopeptidase [Caldalkalibacillus mannanilyticus]